MISSLHVLLSIKGTDAVDNGSQNTPSVTEVQVHLCSELARLVAHNAQDEMT